MSRVVVGGAGLGGLSAACHLAGAGHEVTVLERSHAPGGLAGRLERDGYQFDTGPTVLTMPDILRSTFEAAGADMDDFVRLLPVDPAYRACFADESELRVRAGEEAMAQEIRSVCGPRQAAAFHRFARWLRELYDIEMPSFIDRNYDSPLDLVRPPGPALRLLRLGAFGRLAPAVSRYFDDERLQRLFSFQALYAGLAPYQALALYGVISYMDTVAGVFFAEGGMHSVATGLAAAAEKAGAELRYSETVERIDLAGTGGGPVVGVRLASGERIGADAVVCNGSPSGAYARLLPGLIAPARIRRARYSPSAVVWHAGVKGTPPPGTALHNIHFGGAWKGAFSALLDDGVLMADPSWLVSVPTQYDASLAPAGRSVIYALEPAPNLSGRVDWRRDRSLLRDRMAARVAQAGYGADVEVEELYDPTDWQSLGLEQGTPFSLAHTFTQTGPFRPANVERRAPGLVFTGAGTVPGVGVPMVLLSGRLAAERVAQR
jgi:phytoene desaturase